MHGWRVFLSLFNLFITYRNLENACAHDEEFKVTNETGKIKATW